MNQVRTYSAKIIKHPFFSGSMIMIVGSNIGNFFAYLYHIIFGRILTKAEYGDLAAFLAIIGMMGALLGFVGLVIVKFVASSDEKDIPSLMKWFFDRTLFFVSIISFIFVH